MLRGLLSHRLARESDVNDPAAAALRRTILAQKQFLNRIYREWYEDILRELPGTGGPVIELGSGSGFLKDYVPDLITSDVMRFPGQSLVLDAQCLPFRGGRVRAVVMIDVLHHLPLPPLFLQEAARCVAPGGALIMVEPWVTRWSRFVYGRLHHEPFDPEAKEWNAEVEGPLSGANSAIPWIIFERDRGIFETKHPQWRIAKIRCGMPFSYLLSGGMSMRSFVPGSAYSLVRAAENRLGPWMDKWGMFAMIVLTRVDLGVK